MKKTPISADDFMREANAVHESDLSVYSCPMCKAERAWSFDGKTNYMLVKSSGKGELSGSEIEHHVIAHNGDQVVRADCNKCGFVALFRRGFGPR